MFENPADVVNGGLAQVRITARLVKDVLSLLPDTGVDVHSRPVILEEGLRHKGDRFPIPASNVLDNVFVLQELVGHAGQGVKPHIDFTLTCRAHLVVMNLHFHSHLFQQQNHFGANVLQTIHRRNRKVAFLVAGLVAQVGVLLLA